MIKKILSLTLVVVMIVGCLCGCGQSPNNLPHHLWVSYMEQADKADVALRDSGIEDVESFNNETSLVAYTIERQVPFTVKFLYDDYAGGRAYNLPGIEDSVDLINDREYREWYKANLTLSALDILDEHSVGENGDIIGVIVSWKRAPDEFYSVCDFDGNGRWDYCSKGTSGYDILDFVGGTIDGPSRKVEEQEIKLYSYSGQRIFELSDLTGEETFRDIEKLLKAENTA